MVARPRTSSPVPVLAVLAIGAGVLWWSLGIAPGSAWFYPATALLAAVWAGGALVCGGVRAAGPGLDPRRLPLPAFVLGALLLAVFVLGALVVVHVPWLVGSLDALFAHARLGSVATVLVITVVNGVAEEMFFRGALYAVLPARWAVPVTTGVYALSTVGSGVPLLVFAAVVLGAVTALQRRATGGVLAPAITHITWSAGALLVLPPVIDSLR